MNPRPSIECAKNGPFLLKGKGELLDLLSGERTRTSDVVALCRCGASDKKPYCDGSHVGSGFTGDTQPGRTKDERTDYVGKHITIHDNRGLCAHAAFCTERLGSVFRQHDEPWIDPDGAPLEQVIELVKACPSGALSYSIDGVEHRDQETDPVIMIAPNGPYAVKGGVELRGCPWGEGASQEHYDLCRCGQSKNKPFCDGSHWSTKFDERVADQE